ncbi:hypothetical protein [Candidatus Electronema sp. JM]|uniref:hypothetical protein n=1 Tax=Candidatus Electronema sp. JM TaxID=3401571 RepID=UPI003AA9188A
MTEILPLAEALPHADKFHLIQLLLNKIAWEEGIFLQTQNEVKSSQGQCMARILQRMADRNALSEIADPAAWQREIRKDRALLGRE